MRLYEEWRLFLVGTCVHAAVNNGVWGEHKGNGTHKNRLASMFQWTFQRHRSTDSFSERCWIKLKHSGFTPFPFNWISVKNLINSIKRFSHPKSIVASFWAGLRFQRWIGDMAEQWSIYYFYPNDAMLWAVPNWVPALRTANLSRSLWLPSHSSTKRKAGQRSQFLRLKPVWRGSLTSQHLPFSASLTPLIRSKVSWGSTHSHRWW